MHMFACAFSVCQCDKYPFNILAIRVLPHYSSIHLIIQQHVTLPKQMWKKCFILGQKICCFRFQLWKLGMVVRYNYLNILCAVLDFSLPFQYNFRCFAHMSQYQRPMVHNGSPEWTAIKAFSAFQLQWQRIKMSNLHKIMLDGRQLKNNPKKFCQNICNRQQLKPIFIFPIISIWKL